ncbi:phospholipase D-like domain-containing protein [Piscibacillus halophilus]|uniref:phospholipase D-like domain-containing protein n=1 Tax=Piscibacillus halophilus TaxID=571933 RepID=UPI00240A260D|nr:phospholipase D-like domain-containing protein [Piscibacillus halophilus]
MWVLVVIIIVILLFLIKQRLETDTSEHAYPHRLANIDFFNDGEELYEQYFKDIQAAKHYVCVSFFIVKSDHFSESFFKLLADASTRGVNVYLLVDLLGSMAIKKGDREELKKAGVNIHYSNRLKFLSPIRSFHRRNHRKIAIMDGQTAYIGGYNIGDEYINESSRFSFWRDYHLRLTGEIVSDVLDVFYHDWKLNTNEELDLPLNQSEPGQYECQLIPTSNGTLHHTFYNLIEQAEKRIAIGSPYFIPSQKLIDLLEEKIAQGVKVQIIYPHDSDHILVKEASSPFLSKMHRAGAEVKLFKKGFYHAKAIFIDDQVCDIGTANFDRRSLYYNNEVNLIIYNQQLVQKLYQHYAEDFNYASPFYEDWYDYPNSQFTWLKKFLARIFYPLL